MLYCIVGPSGCGKTTVVSELNKLGYLSPDSYTTRPKRTPDETGHTFITKEEFDALTDIVAYTHFNGYDYCVTKTMLEDCDFYIVDPKGVESLKASNYTDFKVIGFDIEAADCAVRMLSRGDNAQDVLDRIENDWFEFKDFNTMCDYTIDATLTTKQIVKEIIDIVKLNELMNK